MKRYLLGLLWAWACTCHADLGSNPANLSANQLSQREVTVALPGGNTRYQETILTTGTVVHEYLDSEGLVYAVTWKGPFLPDLKALLGRYFGALTSNDTRRSAGSINLTQSDLVLQAGGHMGAFEGRAWLPPKLPAQLTNDQIK